MLGTNWKSWLSSLGGRYPRHAFRPNKKSGYRPQLEALEHRWVPSATASISGFAFQDLTGNGFAASDPGQSGVTINLYQDHNHNGRLDHGDRLLETHKTGSDGSYAFTNLQAGTYFVQELTPKGSVLTAPNSGSTYLVNLANNQTVAGANFANFHTPNLDAINHISYTITDPTLGTYTVTNLNGKTHQGDTVTVNFTVRAGTTATVSLVSYDAPGPKFNAANASQQTLADQQSGTFTAGTYHLTVHIPKDDYQIDFVAGSAITTFGPADSNLFYHKQDRLYSSDNGGTQRFVASSLSGIAYVDANANGQLDTGETVLAQVAVTLTGTNDLGQTVSLTTKTDATGAYSFTGLRQGVYTITDTPLTGYADEPSTAAGSLGGVLTQAGQVSHIVVLNGQNGLHYNLPEVVTASTFSISGKLTQSFPNTPAAQIVLTDNTTNMTTTLTQGSGPYSFTGLTAGDSYTVTVVPAPGYAVEVSPTAKASYTVTNLSNDVIGDNFFVSIRVG